jgi:hypothetical protein
MPQYHQCNGVKLGRSISAGEISSRSTETGLISSRNALAPMISNLFNTMITQIVTLMQNAIVQPTKVSPISIFPSTPSSAGSCQIVPPPTRQRLPPTDKSKPASLLPIRTPTDLEGLLSSIQASLTLDSLQSSASTGPLDSLLTPILSDLLSSIAPT